MPATKHNMFAIKLIGLLIGIVSTAIGLVSVNWGALAKFGTSVSFLYDNVEHLEHMLDDGHEVLGMTSEIARCNAQIDSLKNVLFVISNRDSLIHVIELLNRGKLPYDSIWRKSNSGHWYLTTVDKHFNEEHEN
jgi:hypothetical protein